MIKKLKYNKILAFILLIITILGVAQPIFAASGTGSWICGQYASYIKTPGALHPEHARASQQG